MSKLVQEKEENFEIPTGKKLVVNIKKTTFKICHLKKTLSPDIFIVGFTDKSI